MSDETATNTGSQPTKRQHAPDPDADMDDADRAFATRLRRYLDYAVLAGLLLLALVAVLQFYLNATQTISTWVTPEYRAPFKAVFNIVILLVSGLGISIQLRRLT
jgi:hypothetical protein